MIIIKAVGIICEYNPFHNGHIHHLNEIKKQFEGYTIILVMSGNFMQRGEISILNKWDKTEIALNHGVDLVIELPFIFSTQSADIFGYGAIEILNYLNVEYIVFGSETNNISVLQNIVKTQKEEKYNILVKYYLDKGYNYPTSMSKALTKYGYNHIDSPNDLLGISYIKAIDKLNSNIIPISIKRTNNYHKLDNSNITSASSIRKLIEEKKDISNYVPYETLNKISPIDNHYFELLKYKILTCNDLSIYQTVDEGLNTRIKKYVIESKNLDELISKIKTKRYTYNKISRALTHILCSFTKAEASIYQTNEYIRILGFNKNGRKYLSKIKKDIQIPIITKYKDTKSKILDIEIKVGHIYNCIINKDINEYKKSVIIK